MLVVRSLENFTLQPIWTYKKSSLFSLPARRPSTSIPRKTPQKEKVSTNKFANLFLQRQLQNPTLKPKWNRKETSFHLILPGILSTWASAFLLVCGRMLHELLLFLVAITFLIVAFATSVCTFLGVAAEVGHIPQNEKTTGKMKRWIKKLVV